MVSIEAILGTVKENAQHGRFAELAAHRLDPADCSTCLERIIFRARHMKSSRQVEMQVLGI